MSAIEAAKIKQQKLLFISEGVNMLIISKME